MNDLRLPALYEQRFGVRIGLADLSSAATLPALLGRCAAEAVQLLIIRCATVDLPTVHALESARARLMDTLVYYKCSLQAEEITLPPADADITIRPARPEDADPVEGIASAVFAGYNSHFHADPRLDRAACDAVYTSWARNSILSRQVADEVLIAEVTGQVAGFLTLKHVDAETGEGPLYGVAPEHQGKGLGQLLMRHGIHWFQSQGVARMQMSTQVTNTRSQQTWIRQGFRPSHSFYTFHRWFDE